MISSTPAVRYQIIHEMITNPYNSCTIRELCEWGAMSRSGYGYYKWLATKEKREQREEQDRRDFDLILEEFNYRGYKKGAREIHLRLLRRKPPIIMNIKKIRRLMKKFNLSCPIRKANPYRQMARATYENKVVPNIVDRKFTEYGPRMILLTDITYIPYRCNGDKRFAYLCTILDACTKEVLSYAVSDNLKIDFVLEAGNELIERHGLSLSTRTLVHSDQGVHFTSIKFSKLLSDADLRQSMSRRGNCWDNAPQESFFGHIKDEIDEKISKCGSTNQICEVIDDWMDYYNNDRYQMQLAKLTPTEYYIFLTTGNYPIAGVTVPEIKEWKNIEEAFENAKKKTKKAKQVNLPLREGMANAGNPFSRRGSQE